MLPYKQIIHGPIPKGGYGLLVGDIGGTNSNFGIAYIHDEKADLVLSLHIKSKEITDFAQVVKDVLDYVAETYLIRIKSACFAAAGVVTPKQNRCKPTNLSIIIDAHEIMQKTGLTCAFIVNDFEVIGYGIDHVDPKDIVTIQKGTPFMHGNKAILGAGTGLGKAILRWVDSKDRHIPVASEGGHADFAAQTELDLQLISYIRRTEQYSCNISWEHVLSGKGIQRIYGFFNAQYAPHSMITESPYLPDEVFAHRDTNRQFRDTFDVYSLLYARCAKNWALDALALGGVYIAGGIAANNAGMFVLPHFMQEFVNCGKQRALLASMPVRVITDYHVSLYGAIEYMRLEGKCTI